MIVKFVAIKKMFQFVVSLFIFTCLVQVASFHGMLLDPVNRSSRWRFDPLAPVDYNDNEGFCGGFYVSSVWLNIAFIPVIVDQWAVNGMGPPNCGH